MERYNKGLIYTDTEACVGCNNCIRGCPELAANVVEINTDGDNKIHLDENACILCGHCLETCTHNVRLYLDDTDSFMTGLKSGRKISVLIAPALLLNYPDEYRHILGYLKSIGVNKLYSVSFGADITTWAYLNFIVDNKAHGKISQPCPVIVSYIEKHETRLLDNLMPVQSPMMAMAIYLKKYMNITDELAFISPCVAKKVEIEAPRGQGLISYNVTFTKLMESIRNSGSNVRSYPALDDELEYGMGSIFPVPGGLRENVEFYLGHDAMVLQAEGEQHVYEYLRGLPPVNQRKKPLPILVDALNCSRGCNYGTATEFRHTNNDYVQVEAFKLRQAKKSSIKDNENNVVYEPDERFAILNEKFSNLNIRDFLCTYEKLAVPSRPVSDREIDEGYINLHKHTHQDRTLDCQACGYHTCEDMVKAIALHLNRKENCIYYMRGQMEQHASYQQKVVDKFGTIASLIAKLIEDNLQVSQDTIEINGRVETAVTGSDEVRQALESVQMEFKKLTETYSEVSTIARKTNILSINATIEAAHAGQYGRGFAIVASEVGDLAQKSMAAANKTQENSDDIYKVLDRLMERTSGLISQIDDIKNYTGGIRDNVEGITAKTEEILSLMEDTKG